jgi:hypothetical protein
MDYGFRSRNGLNFFQIDSVNRVLGVAASGSYVIGKPPGAQLTITSATITYPAPITTPDPPMVFLNPNNQGMYHTLMNIGSPGNWTGFSFQLQLMSPFNSSDCSGKWLVATFRSVGPPSEYDIRLKNAAGEVIFVGADNLLSMRGFPVNEGWSLDNRGEQVGGSLLVWLPDAVDWRLCRLLPGFNPDRRKDLQRQLDAGNTMWVSCRHPLNAKRIYRGDGQL